MTEFEREVKIKEIEAAFYAIRTIASRVNVDDACEGSMDVYKAVRMIRSFCNNVERKYEELKCGD